MLYDLVSLSIVVPHGDPTPEAKFREEFYNTPEPEAPKPEATDPQLTENSRALREQVLARVAHFFG